MVDLVWYLVIKSLDQRNTEHIKTFDTLMQTCQSSRRACQRIAQQVYQDYLAFINAPASIYVWRQALDGWGGYYHAQWRIADRQPEQHDIDTLGNSKGWVHKRSIKEVLDRVPNDT